ncbi:dipeptidase [Alicyclobacillus macrosporangiidus]|uniref:dipeptidase n=1 Tax=Alicyclobacillus macrosporangiidus TaxID=392015 RepID=UPI0026EBE5A9|nr:dipeptidase [Alicyclobacillus macrosporangiidus]
MTANRVADAHVDVLWRMLDEGAAFHGDSELRASYRRLWRGGVCTQVFALYVPPHRQSGTQLEQVLTCIDLFYRGVVRAGQVAPVRSREELRQARERGELAALLSLEGGGCLRGQTALLRVLFDLGVRGVGLTWNDANELADGCREPRGAGLTEAGRQVVREMARLGMWLDLAHLSDAGMSDALALTDGPVMASHANARAVHAHPRNLPDEVIRELIRRRGWIGLVFEASFVAPLERASTEDVFRHLDHILDLGGEDCVGFGSDFDGASHPLPGLADAADYAPFAEQVVARYGRDLGEKILWRNFERFLMESLPNR